MGLSGQSFHLHNEKEKIKEPGYSGKAPRCLVHNSNTHTTSDCRVYAEKTPEEKWNF